MITGETIFLGLVLTMVGILVLWILIKGGKGKDE